MANYKPDTVPFVPVGSGCVRCWITCCLSVVSSPTMVLVLIACCCAYHIGKADCEKSPQVVTTVSVYPDSLAQWYLLRAEENAKVQDE